MRVPVRDVVHVGVAMDHRLVAVPVGVRCLRELGGRVLVLVVLVVGVFVRMLEGRVLVPVLVPIGRQEQGAGRHRRQGQEALYRKGLTEEE